MILVTSQDVRTFPTILKLYPIPNICRYFDGSSLIAVNGEVRAQGSQFAIKEIEVITANVDLEEVLLHTSYIC